MKTVIFHTLSFLTAVLGLGAVVVAVASLGLAIHGHDAEWFLISAAYTYTAGSMFYISYCCFEEGT